MKKLLYISLFTLIHFGLFAQCEIQITNSNYCIGATNIAFIQLMNMDSNSPETIIWSISPTSGVNAGVVNGTNNTSYNATFNEPGIYTIVMSASDCSETSLEFEVFPLTIIETNVVDEYTLCNGNLLVGFEILNPLEFSVYHWSNINVGDNSVEYTTDSSFNVELSSPENFTFIVSGTDLNGCVNEKELDITINEGPTLEEILISVNNQSSDCVDPGSEYVIDFSVISSFQIESFSPTSYNVNVSETLLSEEFNIPITILSNSGCSLSKTFTYSHNINLEPSYTTGFDGICDENEMLGCTDDTAINYNESATDDDDTCEYEGAGNCTLPNPFVLNTGANMTVVLLPALISSLNITEENAYLVALTGDGLVVGSVAIYGITQTSIAVWGNDSSTPQIDGAMANESISFQLVNGTDLYDVVIPTTVSYTTNGMSVQYAATLTDACPIYICSDPNYLEYYFNPTGIDLENANTEEICSTPITSTGLTSDMFTDPINTGANMTLPMPGGLLEQFSGGQIAAFMGDICVGLESITTGFIAMGLWGDDSSTELIDGLLVGEVPTFAVLYNGGVISLDQNEMTGYQTNGIATILNFQFTEPIGCTNPAACNYLSYALIDDGSCILPIEFYNCNNSCINDTDNDGICDELEIPGCTEWGYNNYNELATDNDGSCTVSWQEDYTSLSLSSNTIIDSIETDYTNYITNSTATIDSLQAAYDQLDGLSISIDLLLGWNIIGYTNSYEQDAEEALFAIEDLIEVFKDNNADVYMPEYGFNGIGNLVPGQGYQIKVSEAYNSFSFENSPIFGCTYENSINYNSIALIDDGTCITIVYGCTDPWSENYNPYATMNDGSCFYYMCYDPFCGTPPISFDPWCQWMLNDFSTDPTYLIDGNEFNDYIDEASQNDGAIYGCTDPEAFNYNSSANSYDGTCTYP